MISIETCAIILIILLLFKNSIKMYINTYNIFMNKLFCYKLDQILIVTRF